MESGQASGFSFGAPALQPQLAQGFMFGGPQSNSAAEKKESSTTDLDKVQDADSTAESQDVVNEQEDVTSCVLDDPDEPLTDVILEVEGKQLHASRAVLALYSPVFRGMFFSDFKEKEQKVVPLPDKSYKDMAIFFNVMFPTTPTAECIVKDENLPRLLALADEYGVDQVKAVCQNYIGDQLGYYYRQFYEFWTTTSVGIVQPVPVELRKAAHQKPQVSNNVYPASTGVYMCTSAGVLQQQAKSVATTTLPIRNDSIVALKYPHRQELIDRLLLYLHLCHQYDLPNFKDDLKQLAVALCKKTNHAVKSASYESMVLQAKVHLLEGLCRKFDANQK